MPKMFAEVRPYHFYPYPNSPLLPSTSSTPTPTANPIAYPAPERILLAQDGVQVEVGGGAA